MQLRIEGRTYAEIAHRCKYKNALAAEHAVWKALRREVSDKIEEMRNLDLARLDYMLTKLWPGIEEGKQSSVHVALEVMQHRAKIMGLYGSGQRRKHQDPREALAAMMGVSVDRLPEMVASVQMTSVSIDMRHPERSIVPAASNTTLELDAIARDDGEADGAADASED